MILLFLFSIWTVRAEISSAVELRTTSWALEKIQALRLQELRKKRNSVLVAIVDTGIDMNHPILKKRIWTNPGESGLDSQGRDKCCNGIDDDNNGFIDDVHGWNFINNTNDLTDRHGHGTHIAGLIQSVGGENSEVQYLILKYYDTTAQLKDPLPAIIGSFEYAKKMGAQIINFSGGGLTPDPEEFKVLQKMEEKNILVVAAAGNEQSNSDVKKFFPADYGLGHILSVTALDFDNQLLPQSNYGELSVDLAAPGGNLYSTLPQQKWGYMSGTSQATALVSGSAAELLSLRPELNSPRKLIRQLVLSGNTQPLLQGKIKFKSQLNVYRAATMVED